MNKKGFSLAEMLISLLIIGIIVAVSTPVIVRGKTYIPENTWHWTDSNNAVFFGTDDDQKVIVGNRDAGSGNGKLVIYQNNKSALDFYTHPGSVYMAEHIGEPPRGINYAGSISAKNDNISFGIGALYKINVDDNVRNTAIGHFSQYLLTHGQDNTSAGYSALRKLKEGDRNTVIGYEAGRNINDAYDNVIIGYNAGSNLGYPSMNTIIGAEACNSSSSDYPKWNICLGYKANGNEAIDLVPRLYIGNGKDMPFITGILDSGNAAGEDYYKSINFNVSKFSINSYDGFREMFSFLPTDPSDTVNKTGMRTNSYYYYNGNSYTSINAQASENELNVAIAAQQDTMNNLEPEINFNNELEDSVSKSPLSIKFKKNGLSQTDLLISAVKRISFGNGNGWLSLTYLTEENTGLELFVPVIKSAQGLTFNFNNNRIKADNINFMSTDGDINITVPKNNSVIFNKTALYLGDIDAEGKPALEFSEYNHFLAPSGTTGNDGIILKSSSNSEFDIALTDTHGNVFATYSLELTNLRSFCNNKTNVYECMVWLYNDIDRINSRLYPSDLRLKNIQSDSVAGIDEINKLQIKNFTYKDDKKKEPHVGVIAQDLQKIFPNSVFKDKDGYLRIKTEEMFYAVVNSIKQLNQKLKSAAIRITGLEKRINALENENKKLKKKNEEFEKRFAELEAKKTLNGKDAK